MTIHFNGEEIRAIHFPHGSHRRRQRYLLHQLKCHSHGGSTSSLPDFRLSISIVAATVEGLTKNIGDVIAKLPAGVKIIPGHGPLSTPDDLKSYHRMLLETTDIVRKKMAAGKTLDQIKGEGLPDEWESWGTGFIKTDMWLEMIHRSLTGRSK